MPTLADLGIDAPDSAVPLSDIAEHLPALFPLMDIARRRSVLDDPGTLLGVPGYALRGDVPRWEGYGRNSLAELRNAPESPSQRYNNSVTESLYSAGVPANVADYLGPKLGTLAQMFSPVGIATSVEDAAYYAERGEYLPVATAALGAVPGGKLVGKALPMDQASRMARAKEMGFYTDMPLYHGTATEFPAFSLETPARNSHGPLARTGPWTTRDPAYASDFAALSSDLGTGFSPQVLPLLHRAEKPVQIDAAALSQRELAGAVLDAWDAGHDAMLIQNYTIGAFGKVAPTTNLVVRNPNQLRSRFAAFDPSKSHLADLLASLAIVPVAGVLGAQSGDDQ